MALENVSRPGINGTAWSQTGLTSEETLAVSEVDRTNVAAVTTALAAYAAMVGTKQTVITGIGRTVTNVMVLDVRVLSAKRVETAVGGTTAGNYLLRCQWRLQLP